MAGSVFSRALRDQWRGLAVWTVAMAALGLAMVAFYPSVAASAASMQDIAGKMPEALRNAFIGSDMTTATGWLDTKLMSMLAPVVMLVFAVGAGGRAVAGEEETGTLDLLLAQPVARTPVLLEKYAAFALEVVVPAAALIVIIVVTGPFFDVDTGVSPLLQGGALLALLGLAFGSIAFFVGAWTGRRGLAYGVAGGLALLMYLVNVLGMDVDAIEPLRPLSLFYYYGIAPIHEGLGASAVAVFVGTALVTLALGVITFGARDVH